MTDLADSRVAQICAALDDARTMSADLLDEIPAAEWPVRHYLQQVRAYSNAALLNAEKLR